MRAKYYCSEIEVLENSAIAHLKGVQGSDAEDDVDSNEFNVAAPIGRLQIWIDNPRAEGFFQKGKEYYLDISEA